MTTARDYELRSRGPATLGHDALDKALPSLVQCEETATRTRDLPVIGGKTLPLAPGPPFILVQKLSPKFQISIFVLRRIFGIIVSHFDCFKSGIKVLPVCTRHLTIHRSSPTSLHKGLFVFLKQNKGLFVSLLFPQIHQSSSIEDY